MNKQLLNSPNFITNLLLLYFFLLHSECVDDGVELQNVCVFNLSTLICQKVKSEIK